MTPPVKRQADERTFKRLHEVHILQHDEGP